MKIFTDKDGNIRLQLKDLSKNIMLFDFSVEPEHYTELKEHIITNLKGFNP